jgi:Na+/melibiose symporter-like transporter
MGVWVFFSKLALAISAVISLPLLSALGYDPAMETKPADALFGLAVVYALLPCAFKLAAAWLLWKRNEL